MCTASCTVPLAVIPPSTNSLDTICETLCSCFETTMTCMAANFVHFALFLAHRLEEPKAVIDICQSPLAGALLASPRVWRVSGGRKWGSSPWCRAGPSAGSFPLAPWGGNRGPRTGCPARPPAFGVFGRVAGREGSCSVLGLLTPRRRVCAVTALPAPRCAESFSTLEI